MMLLFWIFDILIFKFEVHRTSCTVLCTASESQYNTGVQGLAVFTLFVGILQTARQRYVNMQ